MDDNVESMINTLQQKNAVFQKLFNETGNDFANLVPTEETLAYQLFKETFPNYPHDLRYLVCQWVIQKSNFGEIEPDINAEQSCSKDIFDAGTKKYLKPQVLPARKRRVPVKFNIAEFLRQKRANGDYQMISTQERDLIKDLMDDLQEEKARNDQRSDIALNKIIQMAIILNGVFPYRLLEPHPEKNIH